MSPEQFKLAELALVVVAVLGFGIWQLWSVKRDQRRFGDRDRNRREPGTGAEQDGEQNAPR